MKPAVTATFLCALSSQVVAEPRCVCDYHTNDGHWEAICKSPRDVTPNCAGAAFVRPDSGGGFGLAAKRLVCDSDTTLAVASFEPANDDDR
jgi:hypothetical protein